MTKTEWQAKITGLVDQLCPDFGWDEVAESEWDALWIKRLTPEDAAHSLMNLIVPDNQA
jgi:hypothetical protein